MFDEVYHVVSAQAYARNDPAGYEWWHSAPKPGTAYEWLHPPIGKLLQALGIVLFGDHAFSWRIFNALFGAASIPLLYFFGLRLFQKPAIAFLAAFLWSLDWLAFVTSRIAMNDIFVTFFVVLAALLFWRWWEQYPLSGLKNLMLVGLSIGLAVSSKWSGLYLLGPIGLFALVRLAHPRGVQKLPLFSLSMPPFGLILIPLVVYLLSYGQWWLQGHTWEQFRELHKQTWWYQTHLTATHPYQSAAWTWPLGLRPVWVHVERFDGLIGNIYAMGNPLPWWAGLGAVFVLLCELARRSAQLRALRASLLFTLLLYFVFWVPWIFSPRIMFLYHYLPALPFLYLMLSYFLLTYAGRRVAVFFAAAVLGMFLFFLPHLNGLPVPVWLDNLYYLLPSWR